MAEISDRNHSVVPQTSGLVFHFSRRMIGASPALRVTLGVCTENSNPDVMMVKPAEDRV